MDIDATFAPVAVELIDNVFPTPITYHQPVASAYDPRTGAVAPGGETATAINAGVLSRGRVEEGGAAETYELRLWIHHSAGGLPVIPTTADSVTYDGKRWKVTQIDPTYSSKQLIASKIMCRNV